MARMRASTLVTLALFGAGAAAIMVSATNQASTGVPAPLPRSAALPAPPAATSDDLSQDDWLRNTYSSREECIADYSEAECREEGASGGTSGGGGGGYFAYFGPWYRTGPALAGAPPNPGPGKTAVAAGLKQPASGVQRFRPSTAGSSAATTASRAQRGGFGGSSNYYGSRVS
jgi:hypothetical protein